MREVYALEKVNNKYLPVFQSATKGNEISGYHTWYNINELLTNLSLYKVHLKRNYNSIIRTGYPLSPFTEDVWLDSNFTITLPDKVPANIYGRNICYKEYEDFIEVQYRAHISVWDVYKYIYAWGEHCPLSDFNSIIDAYQSETNVEEVITELENNKVVSFNKAEYASFLSQKETEKCIELRKKFLDFKLEILKLFISSLSELLRNRNSSMVYKPIPILHETAKRLIDSFSINEISFILKMEQKFKDSGFDRYLQFLYGFNNSILKFKEYSEPESIYKKLLEYANDNSFSLGFFSSAIGGLHALIRSIGVVEHEVHWTPMEQMKREKKVREANIIPPEQMINEIDQKEKAYLKQEEEYWMSFNSILESIIEEDGTKEVVLNLSLKLKYMDKFYPKLAAILQAQVDHINETGDLIAIQSATHKKEAVEEKKVDNYKFLPNGEYFITKYNGKDEKIIKSTNGMKYIHMLLSNPREEISIEQFYFTVLRKPTDDLPNFRQVLGQMANIEKNNSGFGIGLSKQLFLTDNDKNRLRKIIQTKEAQLNSTTNPASPEDMVMLKEEIEEIKKYISLAGSLYGLFKDQQLENLRTTISKSIDRALKNIKSQDYELSMYLKANIHIGFKCSYNKEYDDGIEWKLT